jgi:hypothetical protein
MKNAPFASVFDSVFHTTQNKRLSHTKAQSSLSTTEHKKCHVEARLGCLVDFGLHSSFIFLNCEKPEHSSSPAVLVGSVWLAPFLLPLASAGHRR